MKRLDLTILCAFLGAVFVPLILSVLEVPLAQDEDGKLGGLPWFSLFVGSPLGLVLGGCAGAWWGSDLRRKESRGR